MEQNIKCCDYFLKMKHHFNWHFFKNNKGQKVLVMPALPSVSGENMLRINHCPSCGKEIRNIELIEKTDDET